MVTYKNSSWFSSRTNGSQYQQDVSELPSVFTASAAFPEQIPRFRNDRLSKITAGKTPIILPDGAKIVLHLIPISNFRKQSGLNLELLPIDNYKLLSPLKLSWYTRDYNIDGTVTSSTLTDGYGSYLHVFRDGVIEACDAYMLYAQADRLEIPALFLENELISATSNYLKLLKQVEIRPPVVILLSMLNVKGYSLIAPDRFSVHQNGRQVDRGTLILPDILIEDYDADVAQELRPIFDAIWQAGGWERCLNYDKEGQRISI